MSKVTGPLFSLDAKGTIRKTIVFQGCIASGKVNQYRKQKDAESERQLLVRTLFDEARQRWNAASSEIKAFWNAKAKFRNKTGYDLFIQYSINNLLTMDYKKSLIFTVQDCDLASVKVTCGAEGSFSYMDFQDVEVEGLEPFIYLSFRIPRDFKPNSSLRLRISWYSDDQASGDVKWEMKVGRLRVNSGDKVDDAPQIYIWIDTTNPTAKELCITDGVEFGNPLFLAGDVVGIIIKRKSADVLDTLTGGARAVLVRCRYISDRLGEKV